MKFLGDVFKVVSGGGVIQGAADVLDRLTVSEEERRRVEIDQYKAETERIGVEQEVDIAQIEVNKEAAKHKSWFVAGARPFIIWVGGVGFGFHAIVFPCLEFLLAIRYPGIELPELDTVLILTILGGVLGIGKALRTVDKAKGTATDYVNWSKK